MPKELTLKEQLDRKRRLIEKGVIDGPVTATEDAAQALARAGIAGGEGMNGSIHRRTDPMEIMYDAQGCQHVVPGGSVRALLKQGLSLECPVCGGLHADNNPNACPDLEPVRYRACPICGKKIYDDRGVVAHDGGDDPNAIPTGMPSTPEARTLAKLHQHIIAYHETQARMMGLLREPAPQAVEAGR